MNYQSLVDDALQKARARAGGAAAKVAAAPAGTPATPGWRESAEKVANALEYVSLATADDGTVSGAVRAELVRDFFHEAGKLADGPKITASPEGTQAEAPRAGAKKILPEGQPSGDPKITEAPEGKMSRTVLEQTPKADPSKSAASPTLFDVLMGKKAAKTAADVPGGGDQARVMESTDKAPARNMGQEGGGQANAALANNEAPVNATRAALHAPTRDRLKEIFANVGDTAASKASAKIVAPKASASGNLKNASIADMAVAFQAEAVKEATLEEAVARGGRVQRAVTHAAAAGAGAIGGVGLGISAERSKKETKTASILEYADLWDKAYSGDLGEQVKAAAAVVVENMSAFEQAAQ